MNNTNSKLFTCPDGAPFEFYIRECFDKPRLITLIQAGGGKVVNEVGPHTISLVPPIMSYYKEEFDVFGYDFVVECLSQRRVLSLNVFRIGLWSKYKDYDPNDVLLHRISWDNIPLLDTTPDTIQNSHGTQKLLPVSDSEASHAARTTVYKGEPTKQSKLHRRDELDSSNTSSSSSSTSNGEEEKELPKSQLLNDEFEKSLLNLEAKSIPRKVFPKDSTDDSQKSSSSSRKKLFRKSYGRSDQLKILQYIIEEGGYCQLKGNLFWKNMEKSNTLSGRTWQSMKEHFLKKIYPQIHVYGLSDEVLKRFRYGMTS